MAQPVGPAECRQRQRAACGGCSRGLVGSVCRRASSPLRYGWVLLVQPALYPEAVVMAQPSACLCLEVVLAAYALGSKMVHEVEESLVADALLQVVEQTPSAALWRTVNCTGQSSR